MNNDIFSTVRETVTAAQTAELYSGLTPNHSSFIKCPFHAGGDENTPSLKLYENGSFHCFGCGVSGSCIDYVMLLFHETVLEATEQINSDFNLRLEISNAAESEKVIYRRKIINLKDAFNSWRDEMLRDLCLVIRVSNIVCQHKKLEEFTEEEVCAVKYREIYEMWYETLSSKENEQELEIFRKRKVIEQWIAMVLSSTKTKFTQDFNAI